MGARACSGSTRRIMIRREPADHDRLAPCLYWTAMRIAVIGAGGTGGLYGALLARAGNDVRILARGAHLVAIRERGLRVKSAEFGEFSVQAPASDDASQLGDADLALFAVKTYDLAPAAEAATHVLGPDSMLLTLQNGLDAPDHVADIVGTSRVLIGTTG